MTRLAMGQAVREENGGESKTYLKKCWAEKEDIKEEESKIGRHC